MPRFGSPAQEGLFLGLIGYAAVAVFYTLFDVLGGRDPLFTLNLMGLIVFRGARDPAVLQLPMETDMGAMMMYNLLHLAAALAVGWVVAWMVSRVERRPSLGWPVTVVLLLGYVLTILALRTLTLVVSPLIPFWSLVVVNTLVALCGGAFLWWAHPGLLERVRSAGRARPSGAGQDTR